MPDLGKTILIDDLTGDPYFDLDGNMVMIEEERLLRQSVDVLIHTFQKEDVFALEYGFDFYGVMDGNYGIDFDSGVRIALIEAFDRDSEPLFDGINWMTIKHTGDRSVDIKMSIKATADFDIETTLTVGD